MSRAGSDKLFLEIAEVYNFAEEQDYEFEKLRDLTNTIYQVWV